jgi:phosphatidylinositol 3-kinase
MPLIGNILLTLLLLQRLSLELRVTTKAIELSDTASGFRSRKRSLLYKHDDDLRQEMFAIQFVESCDNILKACGLDLKLLIFRCVPVGKRRGFIEWIPGSVPLSEICQPFAGSILGRKKDASSAAGTTDDPLSAVAKAGLTKYESLHRGDREQNGKLGSLTGNPIQDFLRSIAFCPDQHYMIRKEVMDTYVKSCAGYCVVTYLLVSQYSLV